MASRAPVWTAAAARLYWRLDGDSPTRWNLNETATNAEIQDLASPGREPGGHGMPEHDAARRP